MFQAVPPPPPEVTVVGKVPAGPVAHVRLRCRVTEGAGVDRCVVLSEEPPGRGYGKAALSIASYFRLKPSAGPAQPRPGDSIVLPITFKPGETPPPPANE